MQKISSVTRNIKYCKMSRLLYTNNVLFDMNDWNEKQIKDIFAEKDCIMAITENGETLQKISNQELMSRTQYWTRIKQIGISKWAEGDAIGLVEDGTCLIAKRPIRLVCEERRLIFENINDTVKSWKDVVQVAASNAFLHCAQMEQSDMLAFVNAIRQSMRR